MQFERRKESVKDKNEIFLIFENYFNWLQTVQNLKRLNHTHKTFLCYRIEGVPKGKWNTQLFFAICLFSVLD